MTAPSGFVWVHAAVIPVPPEVGAVWGGAVQPWGYDPASGLAPAPPGWVAPPGYALPPQPPTTPPDWYATPPPSAARPRNPLLAANLALGLGLAAPLTLLTAVPAVVFGVKGLRQLDRTAGRGKVRSWVGIVLGVLASVLCLVLIAVLVIAVRDQTRAVFGRPDPQARAEQQTRILEAEVGREVTGVDRYDGDGVECETTAVRTPGQTATCRLDGRTYTVTFLPRDAFTVARR